MKKYFYPLLLCLPLYGNAQNMDDKIKALSIELADQVVKSGAKTVAVASFTHKGCSTELGKYLAEEITGYLAVSGRQITVVNQDQLQSLMAQNQLTAKGLVDGSGDAAKLGKATGIQALVYGTIVTMAEDVRISANAIRLPTLNVFGFGKTAFTASASMKDMLVCNESAMATNTVEKPLTPGNDGGFKYPGPAPDCKTKATCVVCITNNSSTPIKARLTARWHQPTYYIHPGMTKCYENIVIDTNQDHLDALLTYSNDGNQFISDDKFVIEACKVYKRIFKK